MPSSGSRYGRQVKQKHNGRAVLEKLLQRIGEVIEAAQPDDGFLDNSGLCAGGAGQVVTQIQHQMTGCCSDCLPPGLSCDAPRVGFRPPGDVLQAEQTGDPAAVWFAKMLNQLTQRKRPRRQFTFATPFGEISPFLGVGALRIPEEREGMLILAS